MAYYRSIYKRGNPDGTITEIPQFKYYESEDEKQLRLERWKREGIIKPDGSSMWDDYDAVYEVDGVRNPNYQPWVAPTDVNREEQLYGQGLLDTPVATGETTQYGKKVYTDTSGQPYSEKSQTLQIDGKWVNVPTVFDNGVIINDEQVLKSAVVNGVLQPTSVHNTLDEALVSAQTRSDGIEPTRKYVPPLPEDNSGTITRDPTFQGVEAPEGGILNNMAKVKEERLGALLGQNLVGLLSPKTQGNVYSEQGIPSFDSGFSRPYEGQDYVPMSTERQGIPSYSNPTVDSNVNPLQQPYPVMHGGGDNPFQQPFQPVEATSQRDSILDMVEQRPEYADSKNPLNLLELASGELGGEGDERLMEMVDSGILPSSDYMNLRENAERWKAQDAGVLANRAELTTDDFGQVLPQADIYGNKLTPESRVDLYQEQTDATNTLLNSREFSLDDDISEPYVQTGLLGDQHPDSNEADSYSINLNEVPSLIKDKISNWYNNTNFAKSFKGWKSSAELDKESREINRGKTDFWHESNVRNQQLDAIWSGIKDAYKGTIAPFVTKDSFINALHNPDHPRHQEAVDLPKNLTRGTAQGLLYELPQGTLELGADVVNFVANKFGLEDVLTEDDISFIPEIYPKDKYPELWESGAFNFAKVSAQLMSGYGAIKTALKKSLFRKDGIKSKMATEVLSTGGAGLTLDPTEGNLSTMLNNTDFRNAITEYLASGTDSKVAEDRLKARLQNFVEEGLFGTVASGFLFAQHLKNTPDALHGWGEVMDKVYDVSTMGAGKKEMVSGGIHTNTTIDDLGFYVESENVLNKLKQETNHPEHIRQFMRNNGVTVEEMEETGLLDFLQTAQKNDERVTKTGLLDHIRRKKTELDETQYRGMSEDDVVDKLDELMLDNPQHYPKPTLRKAYYDKTYLDDNFTVMDNEHLDSDVEEWMDYSIPQGDVYPTEHTNIILGMNKLDANKYPIKKGALYDAEVDIIPDWYKGIDDAIKKGDVDLIPENLRTDFTEGVEHMLTERYLDSPYVEWAVSVDDVTFTATGNEEVGIIIKDPNGEYLNSFTEPNGRVVPEPVYSINEANIQIRDEAQNWLELDSQGATKFSEYTQHGLDKDTYREIPITSMPLDYKMGEDYFGSHFDEENVVAHLRLSDRTDVDGNNVLFIEEMQSDWHQTGRKQGYTTKADEEKLDKLESTKVDLNNEYRELQIKVKKSGYKLIAGSEEARIDSPDGSTLAFIKTREPHMFSAEHKLRYTIRYHETVFDDLSKDEFKELSKHMEEYRDFQIRFDKNWHERTALEKTVPDAPLKGSKWQEMAFKRAMRIASDEGYDRVAWTNSGMQIDNYSREYTELFENLYDKKLPGYAEKFAKQNQSQTGKVKINFPHTKGGIFQNREPVNYIDITPELKANVKKGQSMYSATSMANPSKVDDGVLGQIGKETAPNKVDGLLGRLDAKFAIPAGGLLSEESENLNQQVKTKALPNVRNNNLGNIKNIKANDWDGQTNYGSKDTFAVFDTPELGVRALVKVVNANLKATNSYETYVNRYASETKEKAYYKKHGKLMPHLQNYAKILMKSQGAKAITDKPTNIDMFEWIKATAVAEGSQDSLLYFTDKVIKDGINLLKSKKTP